MTQWIPEMKKPTSCSEGIIRGRSRISSKNIDEQERVPISPAKIDLSNHIRTRFCPAAVCIHLRLEVHKGLHQFIYRVRIGQIVAHIEKTGCHRRIEAVELSGSIAHQRRGQAGVKTSLGDKTPLRAFNFHGMRLQEGQLSRIQLYVQIIHARIQRRLDDRFSVLRGGGRHNKNVDPCQPV